MNWQTDPECRATIVRAVEPYGDEWSVDFEDGWSLFVTKDECPIAPQPGEPVLLFGRGIGYSVRGIVIGGHVYRYQTAEQEEQAHAAAVAVAAEKRQRQLDETRRYRDADIAKMPEPFQKRLHRFHATIPTWRRDHEDYEIFCCQEAIVLAMALPTEEQIRNFASAPIDVQKTRVPALRYAEHSGNTFGQAIRLAHCYVTQPALMPKMHGALCQLVGCADYGCFAAYEGKKE